VVEIPPNMRKRLGTGTLLIPAPLEVDALIRRIQSGELTAYGQIRERLAAKYGVSRTCPNVTGILVRIAAKYGRRRRGDG
jgi:hypothetical protein